MREPLILKYELMLRDLQLRILPRHAQPLTVQMQRGKPMMWALVDTTDPEVEEIAVYTIGTGQPFPPGADVATYLGTYLQGNGEFVWHVFWRRVK